MPVYKLHKYQTASVKFMISRPAAGIFLDPGLGKTLITYCAYEILKELKYVRGLLVVTKLRPMKEWVDENIKWELGFKTVVLHGGKKDKLLKEKADVYIINYDGLRWLFEALKGQKTWPFDMVMFDESSMLRNPRAKTRFKLVKKYLHKFKRRYIGTGTPTPKWLGNIWSQVFVLDAGKALGSYITHFRNEFCVPVPIGANGPVIYEIPEEREPEIYDRIKDLVIRFDESEIDMPKLVTKNVEVELPKQARMIYDDMERDLITMIDRKIIVAKNAGVATGKLRQIANGGLYLRDDADQSKDRKWKHLHDAKTDAVLEILDGLEGQPALVSYEFHHDLQRLLKALPKGTPWVGGGVSLKRSNEIKDAWNRGEIECLLGQPSSIAHGMNMQGAGRAVIFHSMVWDYEAYDQFIRRIRRQGQKAKRVFLYHILAKNTVDYPVLASMDRKGASQGRLFEALKQHLRQQRNRRMLK